MRKQKKKSYQRCNVDSSGWTCKFYEVQRPPSFQQKNWRIASMDNFDDLVYSIRYELDAMQENLNNTDDLDGSEAKVNVLLKWIKNSANTIENKIEDWGV